MAYILPSNQSAVAGSIEGIKLLQEKGSIEGLKLPKEKGWRHHDEKFHSETI